MGVREQFRVDTRGPVLRNLLGLTRMDEHRVNRGATYAAGGGTEQHRLLQIIYLLFDVILCIAQQKKRAPDLRSLQDEGGAESKGSVMGNAWRKLLSQPAAVL